MIRINFSFVFICPFYSTILSGYVSGFVTYMVPLRKCVPERGGLF